MAERASANERRALSGERGETRDLPPAELITSRDNKWLKKFRGALQGKGPAEGEPIAVEGPKLIEDAVRSGLEAEALLVSTEGERELERILVAAKESEAGIPRSRILRTTDKLFAGIAATETPQGVAALFRQREWTFEDVLRGAATPEGAYRSEAPLVVVLAGVQDPGNVGTIVRSAEAFGATGVVAARGTADPWSPKALRASAGSALRIPILRGLAAAVLLAQLKMARVKILATRAVPRAAAGEIFDAPGELNEASAIFIGSEGAGLPTEVIHAADATISIAISESVESLNAGVAASVILFEAARQRNSLRTAAGRK
jgi:TrmH family RNA methyltransferase